MDERKNIIKVLEEKKTSDTDEKNRLLEGLGETLLNRIGDSEPFKDDPGSVLGAVLEEYRLLQKEIAESSEMIKALEADTRKQKELEAIIAEKEKEHSRTESELDEITVILGKQLLPDPEFDDISGSSKQQEENLILKIEDLEKKLEELEEQKGGFLGWLGKNAQMAMSKNLLQRNRSTLQRLYRSVGKKFLSMEQEKIPDTEAAETLQKAREIKDQLSSIEADLAEQIAERKKITETFGAEGTPARRITGFEKRIAHVKGQFSKVYVRFGTLAATFEPRAGKKQSAPWIKKLAPFFNEKDHEVLEKIELLDTQIAERELGIKKINASLSIDKKNAEIEKLNKAIENQQEKITFAEEAISGYKKKIAASETEIEELETFLKENE